MDRVELANDIEPMLAVVASRKKDNLISYGELVRLLKALRPDEYEDLRPGSDVLGALWGSSRIVPSRLMVSRCRV
jgi:hypothetical protein